MDRLISEFEVIRAIEKFVDNIFTKSMGALIKDIKDIPSAEPYKGMTNGEVIQTLFPNGKVIERDEAMGYEQMLDDKCSYCSWFDGLWWNSPYEPQESEDKECQK